jgi:hypothetical protein
MVRRHGDMRRICRGSSRERTPSIKAMAKFATASGMSSAGTPARNSDRLAASCGFPGLGLLDHDLRHVQLECRPSRPPPEMSPLLAGGHDHVAAWAASEIAEDTRFNVDGSAHSPILRLAALVVTPSFR